MLSSVSHLIESCGICRAGEVEALRTMKTGMTNHSYAFSVKESQYIIRVPGEGTEKLISRAQEYAVYRAIAPLKISETVHYFDPVTGIKIASYLADAHVCDSKNWDEVAKCVAALRGFHSNKLYVAHSFDLWERLDFYECLWGGNPSVYRDYNKTKRAVLGLKQFIDEQPKDVCLCHIDAVPDNFLFVHDTNGAEQIKLIDWEYAGMQDPHLDIAMFIIYAMYDREETEKLIDLYFIDGCDKLTRMKVHCYIAVSGLVWSNWCEFKHHCGVEFGAYAQRQYDYAREYSEIFFREYREVFGRDYV